MMAQERERSVGAFVSSHKGRMRQTQAQTGAAGRELCDVLGKRGSGGFGAAAISPVRVAQVGIPGVEKFFSVVR